VLDLCDAQQNDRKHSLDGAYFAAGVRGLRIVSHEMPQGAHRPLPLVEVLEGSSVLCDERHRREGIGAITGRQCSNPTVSWSRDGGSLAAPRDEY
jgi:hypothetical protein